MATDRKVDFSKLALAAQSLLQQHGLDAEKFGIIVHLRKAEFEELARQNPGQHPRMILLNEGDNWFVQIQPILEAGDYPVGDDLKPDSFY